MEIEELKKPKNDYWTIIFSIIAITLANLATFVPTQRLILLGFSIISTIFAIILFYINKTNINETNIKSIHKNTKEILRELTEKFNYLKELTDIKAEIKMLKKKRGQVNLLGIVKVIVAIILIYVIIEVVKSLF